MKAPMTGKRFSSLMCSSDGFTLVELLIMVAMLSVLAAMAVPSFNEFRHQLYYKEGARDMTSILRNARSLAVARNLECLVEIDTANRRYRMRVGDRVSDSSAWTTVRDYTTLPDGVTVATSEPTSFTYKPNGTLTVSPDNDGDSSNEETISIRDRTGTTKYTITVSPVTGRIRVS